ncbi:MAG: GspH/FimT family pseudopilin [Gemmataceae bacterium]|nr:GspH/FimT family pseudopilin [Gemmataceae bacterium]
MAERRGMTLLELMLVLAIVAMLAAIAYPSIETMYGDLRVQAAADHLRGRFALARSRAIEDGRPYRFAVQSNSGVYRIAPDSAEFWGDGGSVGSDDAAFPTPLQLEDTLPEDIAFQLADDRGFGTNGTWSTLVVFLPDGSCSSDRIIRLEREGNRPVEIRIRGLTGGITTQVLPMGANR